MGLAERALPVRMRRVAVVARAGGLRSVLVTLADTGVVDLTGPLGTGEGPALDALRRLEARSGTAARQPPVLAAGAPDVARLEREGSSGVLAGEVELGRRAAGAVRHGSFGILVGWAPEPALESLRSRLEPLGASLLELKAPRGEQPPTLLAPAPAADPFRPLITSYGPVPYDDIDPTPFVAVTYCVMFGMMFGDLGDGLLIALAALALTQIRHPRVRRLRRVWPMIAGCGVAAGVFGALYGELFGPTKVIPVLWLDPRASPTRLLAMAIGLGALLLAASYAIGVVNRWREGGLALVLTTSAGLPGLGLLVGAWLAALGLFLHSAALAGIGMAVVASSLALLALGLRVEAGRGAAGVFEVAIGLIDACLRLFSNLFSFGRLAAFGLMHATLGQVVFHAASSLTGSPVGDVGAALVFLVGWALAFALEALVVAVQALRLEYYELFSRIFIRAGRPFRPWRLPLLTIEEGT